MLGSAVHEDLLAEGDQRDGQGDDSNTKLDNVLGLVLVVNLKKENERDLERDVRQPRGLTCFQDSVGTPISSMLGLAQLARALPLVWFFISLLAARNERAPTIFYYFV